MSRIDELKKQYKSYALSDLDIMKMAVPNQANKYTETLVKLVKNGIIEAYNTTYGEYEKARPTFISELMDYGLDYNYLETLETLELHTLYNRIDNLVGRHKMQLFTKFANFNERKLIENNDVTSYSSWDEIEKAVSLAELKLLDKKLEKEIKKVYEDDTWISLRPLSLEASMKYGANTKWCTTTNTGQYYARYSERGILIYNINKQTGYKVACFKNLSPQHDNEFSWWDVTDKKIEALDSELPTDVLMAVRNEIKDHPHYNALLMNDDEKSKLPIYKEGNYRFGEPVPINTTVHRSGGLQEFVTSSGSTAYSGTITTNTMVFSGNNSIGMSTSNPTTQLNVNGTIRTQGISVVDNDGNERMRIDSNGMVEGIGLPEQPSLPSHPDTYIAGDVASIRELLSEMAAEEGAPNPFQEMDERLSEYSQRAEEQRQLSHDEQLLRNIDMGTLEQQMIERMQRLAGIGTREMRIREMDREIERLRNETQPAVLEDDVYDPTTDPLNELNVAEQPVLPSKPKLNIWEQIKSLGKKRI